MKRYLSVWMLFARMTLWKLLPLWGLMGVIQAIVFEYRLRWELDVAAVLEDPPALESVFTHSHVHWVLGTAYVLMILILCAAGAGYGSRCGYTLDRLSISPKAVFITQCVHNAVCFLLLWVLQMGVALGLSLYYVDQTELYSTSQTLFLAAYRSNFLHTFLPLADVWMWIRNILLCACLGIRCAGYPYRQREGKLDWGILPVSTVVLFGGISGIDMVMMDLLVLAVLGISTLITLGHVCLPEEEVNEEP